jgi:hypothetical protein
MNDQSFVKITPPPARKPVDSDPFGTLSIDLTIREAKALSALCQRIGGEPDRDRSARGLFDAIRLALRREGIEGASGDYLDGSTRGIGFKEYKKS